jgi:hypothetical protein
MKRTILLTFLVLSLSGIALKAQIRTVPSDIISKDNVTIDMVKAVFENSLYDVKETAATYIMVKDTYSIYIDLDKNNRYLVFSVTWPINEGFSLQDRFDLLNMISKDVLVVTPYYTDSKNSIVIKSTLWIEGGTTVKNIVLTEKIFLQALNLILDKDTRKIIK